MTDDSAAPTTRTPFRLPHLEPSLADVVVIMMIVGLLVVLALPSGDSDRTHRFPPPGPKPGNDFADVAGEYHQGARGRYWSLSILADGRYSFVWSTCSGVRGRESGSVSRVREDVFLSPIKPIEERVERTFRPIRWGRRMYLIPPGRMQDFCDAVIRGDEPRNDFTGRFYVFGNEYGVTGMPELPEEWEIYLRKNDGLTRSSP